MKSANVANAYIGAHIVILLVVLVELFGPAVRQRSFVAHCLKGVLDWDNSDIVVEKKEVGTASYTGAT